MSNFQFTLSVKRALGKVSSDVIEAVNRAQDKTKDELEELLRRTEKEGGFSAYDYFKQYYYGKARIKPHHYANWTVRNRNGSLEIRNRASYARYLYTSEVSPYHSAGYRSADPHATMYLTTKKDGTKVLSYRKPTKKKYIEITRPNQITPSKYAAIQRKMLNITSKNIKNAINEKIRATSTYKG